MSNALTWMRDNAVIVACIAIILLSIVFVVVGVGRISGALQADLAEAPKTVTQIDSFMRKSVTIPNDDPADPTKSIRICINDKSVEALRAIYRQMNNGYEELTDAVVEFNRTGGGHSPHLLLDQGLFPEPEDEDGSKRFDAQGSYKEKLGDLYTNYLRAGTPPTEQEMADAMADVVAKFQPQVLGAPLGQANENDPELLREKAQRRLQMLINRARVLGVYAAPPAVGEQSAAGAFQIGPWATRADSPTMAEVWEGQMQLWIQQDLAAAVVIANRPDEPEARPNVFTSPVKRILDLTVVPGYIGIDEQGMMMRSGPRGAPARTRSTTASYQSQINKPLPMNFVASPTGRVCNPLYDVRHARMSVIIESDRIPELLNAITEVNLMTPIVERIAAVDQTEHFTRGYIYGDKVDVVQLDLLIESLWLRHWTAGHYDEKTAKDAGQTFNPGLMPDSVRYMLGLPTRDKDYQPEDGQMQPRPAPGPRRGPVSNPVPERPGIPDA
jgi:hypothetical protein